MKSLFLCAVVVANATTARADYERVTGTHFTWPDVAALAVVLVCAIGFVLITDRE